MSGEYISLQTIERPSAIGQSNGQVHYDVEQLTYFGGLMRPGRENRALISEAAAADPLVNLTGIRFLLPSMREQPSTGPLPSIVIVGNGIDEASLFLAAINPAINRTGRNKVAAVWHLLQQHNDGTISNIVKGYDTYPKVLPKIGWSQANPLSRTKEQGSGDNIYHVKTGPQTELVVHAMSNQDPCEDVIFLGFSRQAEAIKKTRIASITRSRGFWQFQGPQPLQ